ncbi:hypothetical protein J6Z19_07360 [bacterium]|nr:hypothetical protein [bacterium]
MNFLNLFFGRVEAFLIFEASAVKKHAAFIFFGLLIPGPLKFFFIFLLSMQLFSAAVSSKKIRFLLSLPFSRSEIFIYSFLFGFSVIFFATAAGWALFGGNGSPDFLRYFVFYAFYFGLTSVNALKIGSVTVLPMLFLAFDLLSPFIAPEIYGFVSEYSPLYQQNQPLSLSAALAVLVIAFLLFVFGRRENW